MTFKIIENQSNMNKKSELNSDFFALIYTTIKVFAN